MDRSYALHVIGDIRDYQKKLAEVPGVTDKQAAAAALKWGERMRKAQEDAAKAAAGAAGKAGKAWETLGETAGGAGGAAEKLRGLAGSIAPAWADLLGTVNDVGDGLELFAAGAGKAAVVTGGLAAAVGVLAVAYTVNAREAQRTIAMREFEHGVAQSLIGAEQDLADAKQQLAVETGNATAAEGVGMKARMNAARQVLAYAEAQREQRREILESIAANESWAESQRAVARGAALVKGVLTGGSLQSIRADAAAIEDFFDTFTGLQSGIDGAEKKLKALDDASARNAAIQKELRNVTIDTDTAVRRKAAGDRAAKEAADALAESEKKAATALDAYNAALAVARGAARTAAESQLEGIDLVRARRDAELAKLAEDEFKAVELNLDNQERQLAIDEEFAAARTAIWAKYLAEKRVVDTEAAARTKEQAAEDLENQRALIDAKRQLMVGYLSTIQAATDVFLQWNQRAQERTQEKIEEGEGTLTDAQLEQLERRKRAQKTAAIAAFVVARAAAVATAVLNAFLASSNATATFPYPANLIAGPAMLAAGLVEAAAIAASPPPKFAKGTSTGVRGNTNEVPIIAHEGELLVTSAAAKRPGVREQVGRFNAGVGGGQAPMMVVDRFQGRLWPTSLRQAGKLGYLTSSSGRRGSRFGQLVPVES